MAAVVPCGAARCGLGRPRGRGEESGGCGAGCSTHGPLAAGFLFECGAATAGGGALASAYGRHGTARHSAAWLSLCWPGSCCCAVPVGVAVVTSQHRC